MLKRLLSFVFPLLRLFKRFAKTSGRPGTNGQLSKAAKKAVHAGKGVGGVAKAGAGVAKKGAGVAAKAGAGAARKGAGAAGKAAGGVVKKLGRN